MKWNKKRGPSAEAQNRRSRQQAIRDLEKKAASEKRERLKTLRQALKLAKEQTRAKCKNRREDARLVAKQGHREVNLELQADLQRLEEECHARMNSATTPIAGSIEELATELRSSAMARKHASQREAARPRESGRETREREFDQVRADLGKEPLLLPIFERIKRSLKPSPRQTLTEAFREYVAETPELLEQEQAKQARVMTDLDLHCAEAKHLAKQGDPDAERWATANCQSRRRPKGSAKSRTLGLYGPDLIPIDMPPKPPEKKPTRPRGSARGQQSLAGGPLGGGLLDPIPF